MDDKPKDDTERTKKILRLLHKSRIKLLSYNLKRGYSEERDLVMLREYIKYSKLSFTVFDDVQIDDLKIGLDDDVKELKDLITNNSTHTAPEHYELSEDKEVRKEMERLIRNIQEKYNYFSNIFGPDKTISKPDKATEIKLNKKKTRPELDEDKNGFGRIRFGTKEPWLIMGNTHNRPYQLLTHLVHCFEQFTPIHVAFDAMLYGKDKAKYDPIIHGGNKVKMLENMEHNFNKLPKIKNVLILIKDNPDSPVKIRLRYKTDSEIRRKG